MAIRRATLFLSLLAVALNVVGAPMVSAHMSMGHDMGHEAHAAVSGMEHCKGHMDADKSQPASSPGSGHLGCCKSGVCSCGCLHAAAISILAISTTVIAPDSTAAEPARAVPANSVEDPLRPPIT